MGVPTHYTRLLQQPGLNADATAGVRLFVSGSAPLLAETHREFLRRTGHAILERYGMTETLMNTSNPYEGLRKPGSVGVPLPGISIRVVDAATGGLPTAGRYHRCARGGGPQRVRGILAQPAENARRIHRGRLVQDRGSRPHRSRRLRAHRRPRQGPRDQRRLQRLPEGSRDGAGCAERGIGERSVRRSAPRFRRGGHRSRRAETGYRVVRGGT